MQRSIEILHGQHSVRLVLSAIDVRLYARLTNPAHINPEFLSVNEVVPTHWQVNRPVNLQTGFSRVTYENGVSVSAYPNYLSFSQRGLESPEVDLLAPSVASRYLDHPPEYLGLNSVSLTFICNMERPPYSRPISTSLLSALAVPFEGVVPNVAIRSLYQVHGRRVIVTISEDTAEWDSLESVLSVRGQVTHLIPDRGSPESLEVSRESLAEWESSLGMFFDISRSLCERHLSFGV